MDDRPAGLGHTTARSSSTDQAWHFELLDGGLVTDVTEDEQPAQERCAVQHGDWTGPHVRISSCPAPGAYDPQDEQKHRFYEENCHDRQQH